MVNWAFRIRKLKKFMKVDLALKNHVLLYGLSPSLKAAEAVANAEPSDVRDARSKRVGKKKTKQPLATSRH